MAQPFGHFLHEKEENETEQLMVQYQSIGSYLLIHITNIVLVGAFNGFAIL